LETHPQAIISDLVKQDALASPRRTLGLAKGKKETLSFLVRISLFKIGDAPALVRKERRVLVQHVSDYVSKGRHALLGVCFLLVMKAGASPFPYKREMSVSLVCLRFVSPI
jgi:hypothetical protein